jgi:hypothetical protein
MHKRELFSIGIDRFSFFVYGDEPITGLKGVKYPALSPDEERRRYSPVRCYGRRQA